MRWPEAILRKTCLRQKLEGTGGVGTVIANELGIGYRLLVDA